MRAGWFILTSLVVALLSGAIAFIAPMTFAALQCKPTSSDGVFLAYCTHLKFTDYEHGAYYLKLEPEAISSLENAQVLVLGTSLAQMSFSTDAASSYFEERDLRYYVTGFGYNEGGEFSTSVLSKVSARPSLYIIHAYAFFLGDLSTPAQDAMSDDGRLHYIPKKIGATFAHRICQWRPNWCGQYGSIYRRRDTGFWEWDTWANYPGSRPIPPTRPIAPPPSPDEMARAERFAASFKVPPECIIVTMTPNVYTDLSEYARRIAEHIHGRALIPQLEGLVTFDGYHLDRKSNERWSKTFFEGLDAAASQCAGFQKDVNRRAILHAVSTELRTLP